jgi:hypothetical protein
MHPKQRSSLLQQLRKTDEKLKTTSWRRYVNFMSIVLESYPESVSVPVLGALEAKDFGTLLVLADTLGSAVHGTVEDSFSAYQLSALIKKYPFPAPELAKQARAKATEKFHASENRCRKYNLKYHRRNTGRWDPDADTHKRMSDWIAYIIGNQPDLPAIYQECGFGPGASVGVHGQNTNLARKYLSREWSCTPAALPYATSALAQDEHVWELLNPDKTRPVCFDYSIFEKSVMDKTRLVHNNNIVFVPKTTLVDRTIAVEPLLNGYVQKGVDNYLRRRLKRIGLDLSDQTVNQRLAYLGSLPNQADPFVTIDLSAASDSISIEVVRRLLPPEWFELLNALRSKKFKLDGVEHTYEKFTSMGNGFCFPLETLIFASACHVSSPGDFVVYGDDIIVRQSKAEEVLRTLRGLGFRHNPDKTFLQGPFRESCGADWFAGRDIRPLTLDYAFDSFESIVKFHNLSLSKPLWASYFSRVREYLIEQVPQSVRFTRPFPGTVDSAFEVPLDRFQASTFAHWNLHLQTWQWVELVRSAVQDKGLLSNERYYTVLTMGAVRGSPSHCPFASRRKTSRTIRRLSYAGASNTWLPPSVSFPTEGLMTLHYLNQMVM